ncbi:MAG TPA: hypothetical protein VMW83_07695 [Spirochaetia bacterium]|nr:hypothetical protein [Spirochaetia bacterium]
MKAEPMLEIPVKVSFGNRTANLALMWLPPGVTVKQLLSSTGGPL